MLQEDFCEKHLGPLVIFQLYLLRTRRAEQHRNRNQNMYLLLGRKHCHFYKRRKIWWLFFCLWTISFRGFFSKRWKGQLQSQCWQGPSFIPIKLRNGNKEPVVLGTLGAENRRRRSQAALSLGPLTFEPEQWHTPGFTEREAFRGFAVLGLWVLWVTLVLFHS